MTTTMFPPPETEIGLPSDIDLDEPPTDGVDIDADAAIPPGRVRQRWSPFRSPPGEPAWARPALLCLLAATGVLYIWGLGGSGWANSFYSAAAQAGSKSWKALFFGSSDSSNFITVDKPPASLWFMSLSIRVFGLNSWSILVPEALMGVASVGVLYTTVKRWFGSAAGLIAGAVLALTPVATLMFRFNNPDALLVLVLIGGAYCVTRALEAGSTKWLSFGFALVGLGFLTKMLQALLVLPAFGLVYLICGPTRFRKRIVQLTVATLSFVAAAGWWVAIVELVPASMRPYVGGSTNNSVLNLIFGYNGFGRLTGNETGSVGGAGGGTSQWGPTGWLRMFNSEFGGQASWLIPAALVLFGTVLVATWRAPRTDKTRAAMILWGGWLIVTAATFSLGQGIIHPYYTVALAPAIGAVVGIGGVTLWKRRNQPLARIALAATVAVIGWWAIVLLRRTPTWNSWLQPVIMIAAIVGVVGILFANRIGRRLATVAIAATLVAGLAGPTAYSLATAASNHSGAIPSAGPSVGRGGFGGGPGGNAGGRPNFGGGTGGPPTGGGFGGGQPPSFGGTTGGTATTRGTSTTGGTTGGTARTGGGGGIGGILGSSTPSSALTTLLETNANQYTWVAATVGANQAAGYQLATQDPVMAIGGFNGTDSWPTLAAFEQYVAQGKIHYFIAGGSGGGPGGNNTASTSSQITSWVESHYTATTVGGTTVYDLTATPSA